MRKEFASALIVLAMSLNSPLCLAADISRDTLPSQPARTIDLSLGTGGQLAGNLVNPAGTAVGGARIDFVDANGHPAATTLSRADGSFTASGLRPGVYLVRTESGSVVSRVWAPGTAPPSAVDGLLLVDGSPTVRGKFFVGIPWTYIIPAGIIAGGVIAIRVSQETAS